MSAYQNGRLEAFDRLYFALEEELRGFFRARCHDAHRVDDLLQDTFLQIHRSRRGYLPGLPVRPWVYAIAKRVFLMHVTPLREDEAGAVTGFVFATVDITASHQSREALLETGIALSRTIDLDRVHRELAQHAQRAVRGTAFCLAVADEGTAALRVVHGGAPNVGVVPESPTGVDDHAGNPTQYLLVPAGGDALPTRGCKGLPMHLEEYAIVLRREVP